MSSYSDTPSLVAQTAVAPYRFVKVTSAAGYLRNSGAPATAGTDFIVGVSDGSVSKFGGSNNAEQGDSISLQGGSVVLVQASAAITAGDRVTATTAGKAVTTTTAGNKVFGIALEPAGGADEIIRVMKLPYTI